MRFIHSGIDAAQFAFIKHRNGHETDHSIISIEARAGGKRKAEYTVE